jgi:Zn-dependent protease
MFAEPPESAYDLRFRVLGVPVRVHPMFWFMALLLSGLGEPLEVLIWIVAVFVSIVVHELGHCGAFRWYGTHAHVVLHGFGGLAIPHGVGRTGRGARGAWSQACIAFAGPAAGFALAALLLGGMWLGGLAPKVWLNRESLVGFGFDASRVDERVAVLLYDLLFVNIWWGLFNLLPIYPLDGGHISRALLAAADPRQGVARSLMLSLVTAVGLGLVALWKVLRSEPPEQEGGLVLVGRFWPVLLFGYLAWISYQALEQERGGWRRDW